MMMDCLAKSKYNWLESPVAPMGRAPASVQFPSHLMISAALANKSPSRPTSKDVSVPTMLVRLVPHASSMVVDLSQWLRFLVMYHMSAFWYAARTSLLKLV